MLQTGVYLVHFQEKVVPHTLCGPFSRHISHDAFRFAVLAHHLHCKHVITIATTCLQLVSGYKCSINVKP